MIALTADLNSSTACDGLNDGVPCSEPATRVYPITHSQLTTQLCTRHGKLLEWAQR